MNAPDAPVSTQTIDEAYFSFVADALGRLCKTDEFYMASLAAERSDFVRLNRGQVRQPGAVTQCYLDIDLIRGARHAVQSLGLSGNAGRDIPAIEQAIAALRDALPVVADDPHLLYSTEAHSTRSVHGSPLTPAEEIVEQLLAAGRGHDLVGLYAGGVVVRAFANAAGQRNWHETTSFTLEWSLYHHADKAVKTSISGLAWDPALLDARMREAQERLAFVARPPRTLAPGEYRAFLTAAAMEELAGMLHWGGFSGRALATRQSSLARMHDEGVALDPRVTMREATADGVAPAFQSAGFLRPPAVPLIEQGRLVGALTSPRTAREFGGVSNGANNDEAPEALSMDGGDLPTADALAALDRGLYIGNLWYLNYSDRPACRITGMTRFATFWVEDGRIVAPVNVLRFDDTLYRMLGSNLEALTKETELLLDTITYRERSLSSMRLPGALLSGMTFTL